MTFAFAFKCLSIQTFDFDYTLFFYKQSIFDPRPENRLSSSKKPLKKLFSNCLEDGLLTSIV